jgi:hypothetical protein
MANIKQDNKLEKHYTPEKLIDFLFKQLDTYHKDNIVEYLENSAGSGNIIDYIKENRDCKEYIAYDIFNETLRPDIKQVDYLKENIDYKKGRVCVMNPPFQKGMKFVYKALKECDYVVTILSSNSILNFKYDDYIVEDITIVRKVDFGSCKMDIVVMCIKNK